MFTCERCGSGYSSVHAVGIENCPRCLLKDRTASPLKLKMFTLPNADDDGGAERMETEADVELGTDTAEDVVNA